MKTIVLLALFSLLLVGCTTQKCEFQLKEREVVRVDFQPDGWGTTESWILLFSDGSYETEHRPYKPGDIYSTKERVCN